MAVFLFYLSHLPWLGSLGLNGDFFASLAYHEICYILFAGPVIYAAVVFRVKGGIMISLIASLAILPDAFLFSPEADPFFRLTTFTIINILLAGFIGNQLNSREQLAKEHARLESYLSQTIGAQERQNRYLARELHDGTLQALVDISHDIDKLLEAKAGIGKTKLEQLRRDVDNVQEESRRFIHGLRPPLLEELGLSASLKWLAGEIAGELHIEVDIQDERKRLAEVEELSLFRIAQEALNNIKRHSQATRVELSLTFPESKVRLRIADNGTGFSVPTQYKLAREGKFGLIGMTERARLVGGSVRLESAAGKGTVIITEMPVLGTE